MFGKKSVARVLGKNTLAKICMSSPFEPFPIAILNGTCSLRALILFCGDVPAIKTKQTNCEWDMLDLMITHIDLT